MTDYKDLIKRLRAHNGLAVNDTMDEAADAIEELSMRLHGDEAAIAGMKREIERMIVNAPRWIPVTERLPEEEVRYLTVSSEPWFGTTVVDAMRWSGVWMYDGRRTVATVTHWMPLPELPKEET